MAPLSVAYCLKDGPSWHVCYVIWRARRKWVDCPAAAAAASCIWVCSRNSSVRGLVQDVLQQTAICTIWRFTIRWMSWHKAVNKWPLWLYCIRRMFSLSIVLFNDTWSQWGHSVSCMTTLFSMIATSSDQTSDHTCHQNWAVSLVIADGSLIFLNHGLCGYVWANILALSSLRVTNVQSSDPPECTLHPVSNTMMTYHWAKKPLSTR